MRHVILMRHAYSCEADAGMSDHDRPLSQRGRKDAHAMANHLVEANQVPGIILASTALRVRETVDSMMAAWVMRPPVYYSRPLYLASPEEMIRMLRTDALDQQTVMLVAHNPGLETLASLWAERMVSMPTAALAVYGFEIEDWRDLSRHTPASLVAVARPATVDHP